MTAMSGAPSSGRFCPAGVRCRAIPAISRFLVARHNLWPKRWTGYDRVVAGLLGFPPPFGIPGSLKGLFSLPF
jgi:hypothetical protein